MTRLSALAFKGSLNPFTVQSSSTITPPAISDPYFAYNTMLLSADGLNNLNNSSFIDSSNNNHALTGSGTVSQGTFSAYGGWSMYFDGSGDYLTLPFNGPLQLGTGDWTIEFYSFVDSSGGGLAISQSVVDEDYGNNTGWTMGASSTSVAMYFQQYDTSTLVQTGSYGNKWTHCACTRSGSTVRLFVNGVLSKTITGFSYNMNDALNVRGDTPTLVGTHELQLPNYYRGWLSNLRIVKGTALYTASFTPPSSPLTAVSGTSLLICHSSRYVDGSSNNYSYTISGQVNIQRFTPFISTLYSASSEGGSVYIGAGSSVGTSSASSTFAMGTGDFTIDGWVFPYAYPNDSYLCGFYGNNTDFALEIRQGVVAYHLYTGSHSDFHFYDIAPTVNAWNHIAIQRQSGVVYAYLNGVRSTGYSSSLSTNFISDKGYISFGNGNGHLTDMRITKGSALYSSNFTPSMTPVTASANTSILFKGTNAAILDYSKLNTLQTVGDAKISTAQSKWGGSSMAFDGTGDYLTTPNAVQFNASAGNWTIEAWVNFSSNTVSQPLIVGNPRNFYFVYVYETSQTKLILGDGSINPILVVISPPSAGTWWHMCCVKNGSTYTVYQNGVAQASTTTSLSNTTLNGFYIGHDPGGATYFNGYIDDLRITKGYARYTANFTPPSAPFATYYFT